VRFSYAEAMCDPAHYLPLARAAEEAGFTSFTIPDSICYPQFSDSRYPYTPDGVPRFSDTDPFPDPWTTVTAMAQHTKTLQFYTNVYVLPMRNAFAVRVRRAASCCRAYVATSEVYPRRQLRRRVSPILKRLDIRPRPPRQ